MRLSTQVVSSSVDEAQPYHLLSGKAGEREGCVCVCVCVCVRMRGAPVLHLSLQESFEPGSEEKKER